jgi:putative restriction endonuclease
LRRIRYWWVNQNQTYREEVRGSFMWSPKRNANGARNQFYENMREVSPGDVVFSFCDTRIKALGIVTGRAQTGPKPDFGTAGANWSQEGWFVPVSTAPSTIRSGRRMRSQSFAPFSRPATRPCR